MSVLYRVLNVNRSVQGLIGLERFTRFGVKTDKVEIAFFSVEPTCEVRKNFAALKI